MNLTKEQTALIATIGKDEKKIFDKMKDEQKISYLVQLETLSLSTTKRTGLEDFDFTTDGLEDYPVFGVVTENNPMGIKKGQTIVGFLEGVVPMFSDKEKKNWDELTYNGKKYYESMHYRFRREDGTKFGIFGHSQLHPLKKVRTKSSDPAFANDPYVEIDYTGLVEGKEKLKAMGIELRSGNSAHTFGIKFEKGVIVDRYAKGVLNYVKAPYPAFADNAGDNNDPRAVAMNNWEKLQANKHAAQKVMIEGEQQRQIQ